MAVVQVDGEHFTLSILSVLLSSLQVLLDKFGAALRAESAGAVLTTATHWEDLEIQEEAESGSSVTSKIRLPVQVSARHHHHHHPSLRRSH